MATTTKFRRLAVVLAAALLVPGALVAACSSDNSNPQPTTPVYSGQRRRSTHKPDAVERRLPRGKADASATR